MKILTVDECMAVSGSMGGGGYSAAQNPGPGMAAAEKTLLTAVGAGVIAASQGWIPMALGAIGGFLIGGAQFGFGNTPSSNPNDYSCTKADSGSEGDTYAEFGGFGLQSGNSTAGQLRAYYWADSFQ